jgi:uncharacterized protein YbjQ (UPF0145 family)
MAKKICNTCGKRGYMGTPLYLAESEDGIFECMSCSSQKYPNECPNCGAEMGRRIVDKKWIKVLPLDFDDISKQFCKNCIDIDGPKIIQERINKIIVTTTPTIEGREISKYINIVSYEVVIGTGFLSEMSLILTDIVGKRSRMAESKLSKAKENCLDALKVQAMEEGGDAIVGIDFAYTDIVGDRIAVIGTGTVVKLL